MTELIELIPTLGFPIVCCVAIGYMFYQMLNKILVEISRVKFIRLFSRSLLSVNTLFNI